LGRCVWHAAFGIVGQTYAFHHRKLMMGKTKRRPPCGVTVHSIGGDHVALRISRRNTANGIPVHAEACCSVMVVIG
jgi:hypothetical protein